MIRVNVERDWEKWRGTVVTCLRSRCVSLIGRLVFFLFVGDLVWVFSFEDFRTLD